MEIKNIYFGEVDASEEKEQVPAEMREDLYYDLENVRDRILNSSEPIMLISGNKGTGKTFLGEYLSYRYPDQVSYYYIDSITATDLDKFSKDSNSSDQEKGRYENAWKYLFYVLMIRELILKKVKKADELKTFMNSIFEDKTDFILDDPFSYKIYLFSKKIRQGIKAPKGYEKYAENGSLKPEALVLAMSAIIADCTPKRFFLLLDGFDNYIRGTLQNNQINQYLDLINACKKSQSTLKVFKCILLFRNDIINQMGGLEANFAKGLTRSQIVLNWNNPNSDPLYSFIEKRYNLNAKRKGYENMSLFADVFCGTIKGQNKWEWLKDLTTYTPRDVISFFNICKANENRANSHSTIFTPEILWNATTEYSNYLWKEFTDSLAGTDLSDKAIQADLENVIILLGAEFQRSAKKILPISVAKDAIEAAPSLKEIGSTKILEILYDIGMIGFTRQNIARQNMVFWKFRENPTPFSAVDFSKDKFSIHKGLWKKIRIW